MQDQDNYAAEYLPQNQYVDIQDTQRQDKKVDEEIEVSYQPKVQEETINDAQGQINNQNKQHAKLNLQNNQPQNQKSQWKKCSKKCLAIVCFVVMLVIVVIIICLFTKTQKPYQKPQKPLPQMHSSGKIGTDFKIVIMATNDLNGKVYPTKMIRPDTKETYNYGGLATLLALKNIAAKQYFDNQFLYLDAGDSVVGGIESSPLVSSGEIMNDFFKSANLTASAVGDSDFGLGPQFQLNYLKGRSTPNLVSNLIPTIGGPEWIPNKKRSTIVTMHNGVKIGLIGIMTMGAKIDKLATILQNKTSPYQVLDYTDIVLNQSKSLRIQGANAIILVAHEGNNCENNLTLGKWHNLNAQGLLDICNSGSIYNLIAKLPNGTVDAVVQGHRNTTAHNYDGQIPFMGTTKGGYYVNFMYLFFRQDNTLSGTMIEGPVPICQKVFQNTGRCDYVQAADISKAGKLIPWKFHDKEVTPDEQFNQIIKSKCDQKMGAFRDQIITNTEITLSPVLDKQNQLGNLFTNLLHSVLPDADFVILDPEIFRSQWFPGPINYEQFYNMFPFTNNIISFMMTGDALIESLKSVNIMFFSVWNLQPIFKNEQRKGIQPLPYLLFNGTKISSSVKYKGVTVLLSYNSKDIFYTTNQARMTNVSRVGEFREKVKPFLKQMGTIKKGTLMDPLKPRAIVRYID